MILLIDNYDSFAYNLARYLNRLGQVVSVHRNDAIDVPAIEYMAPAAIVLSPGPCTPNEAGCCLEVVEQLRGSIPLLGVCLGHQVIVQAYGGQIIRSNRPVHGCSSPMHHNGQGIFRGIPSPFRAGRYHSLVADSQSLPNCFTATARLSDGTIMAVRHRRSHAVGVQFHPEAILTEHGYQLLDNFLHDCGIPTTGVPGRQEPSKRTADSFRDSAPRPITF